MAKKRRYFLPNDVDLARTGGESLFEPERHGLYVPLDRNGATTLKRTGRMVRKPTGIAYFGTPPEYFDRWIPDTGDPLAEIAHHEWDADGFSRFLAGWRGGT